MAGTQTSLTGTSGTHSTSSSVTGPSDAPHTSGTPFPDSSFSLSLVGPPGFTGAATDGEDETVSSLRRMGIRAPNLYDHKREPNFEAWLSRVVFHMSLSKIPDDKRTSSLLLLFDTDSFEAARHLGVQDNTDFDTAKEKLKAYFAITETPEELKKTRSSPPGSRRNDRLIRARH